MLHYYSPLRVWRVFVFLMTLYMLIKKKDRFLFFHPLSPEKLLQTITLLGASFIKLAQVLATRSDFFPEKYLQVLKTLHDELPPMSKEAMQRVYNLSFEEEIFSYFKSEPIASASIGQVHEARLEDGTKVAVKLRREGIEQQVYADIRILRSFNTLFKPLFSHYTKHSVEAVIVEFADMILKEVSLDQERINLQKFSQEYADQPIRFPKAYTQYSCDNALVMSFEQGFRFDDRDAIERYGIDILVIMERLIVFYTEQMLVRGFFHADPHPGNLLISPEGELILLDFGMVKRVPNDARVAIIELIKAANEKDYERYISANKRLGIIAYEAPVGQLAEFVEQMFDIFENDSLDSTSMQELAFDVLNKTRDFPFKLPQEAIYILRVSAIIEGLGTTYIENFNGIKDILPILQKNIPRALGMSDSIVESIISEIKALPMDIMALRTLLHRASEGELSVELSKPQLESLEKSLKEGSGKLITGATLLLSSIFLLLYDHTLDDISLLLFGLGVARLVFR